MSGAQVAAIIAALAGGGGGGGGGGAHRYWRVRDFTGTTASFFETTEIQLLEGVTVRSGGITPSASAGTAFGSLANLTDGVLNNNQVGWTTTDANTLILTFDLGSAYPIDGFRVARWDTNGRLPTAVTLEHSDDNSSWTTVGTEAVVDPGTNYTLCALVSF